MKTTELPPVLCLHSVRPASFEEMVRYLSENRYETLTCDDYYAMSRGQRPVPPRSVLLTFDDGHLSVWAIAYPLLKKYGLQAVTFLIPGRMAPDADQTPRPTLEDAWAGMCCVEEIERSTQGYPLCTWTECRAMNASGVMDFQSHTFRHTAIWTSDRIEGFIHPSMLSKFCPFDTDLASSGSNAGLGGGSGSEMPPLGMPIYTSASRMAEARSYRPVRVAAEACVAYVRERGGAVFFGRPDWKRQLQRVAAEVVTRSKPEDTRGIQESEADRRAAIISDLMQARRTMMEHLPGKEVRYLAYPWGVGSDDAIAASRKTGYVSNFWGKVGHRLRNHRSDDPFRWARIGGDFFFLLEGLGRSTLRRVVCDKLGRRGSLGKTYRMP